jgi:hypothetical protein
MEFSHHHKNPDLDCTVTIQHLSSGSFRVHNSKEIFYTPTTSQELAEEEANGIMNTLTILGWNPRLIWSNV